MDDLIEALQIFRLYANLLHPTYCAQHVLSIVGVNPDEVSEVHKERLAQLNFNVDMDEEHFYSFRFGSA